MTKKFFISKAEKSASDAPDLDRFQRVEKLNEMLAVGWQIKGFYNEAEGSYFVLEKNA
ncbi:MAG: hypothetical protein ACI4JW_05710 [Oscillospiraceae bacterium]